MTFVETKLDYADSPAMAASARDFSELRDSLELCLGARFAVLDCVTGAYVLQSDLPLGGDLQHYAELCRTVLRRGQPEFIAEDDPVALLALPVLDERAPRFVALAPFVIAASDEPTIVRATAALGCSSHEAAIWARRQTVWNDKRLLHLAELATAHRSELSRRAQMQREIDDLSGHLAATYEELSLLYGLTQKLKISASIEDLGRKALDWLAEAISAEGFMLELMPPAEQQTDSLHAPRGSTLLQFGHCPLNDAGFRQLIEHFSLTEKVQPLVINPGNRAGGDWMFPEVRQAVIVPLTEGENLFGWLAVFNHEDREEFGTSEASLLSSVATILGIHAGNLELYRQQAEFLAGVVRAMTSAIDAKDPYTCGHSDRVARIAVRLADQLGCDEKELETIYLSGLLHDIGKIGIDDQVLRKPGKLNEAEYEHIKLHAEIGYRILKDLKQLGQVLPVVRHHHEAWDGGGYPLGLAREEIPFFARIVAVADAFDAMSSDRPYRKGMPDEKLDQILRSGAGTQWDERVIEAYFGARDEIRRIVRNDVEPALDDVALMT